MSANSEQIKAMLERAGKTNLLQKQKVDLDKEQLQFEATVKSLEKAAEEYLQQDHQEVDFAEEIKTLSQSDEWEQMKKRGSYMKEALYIVARHFYRLGLKRKDE